MIAIRLAALGIWRRASTLTFGALALIVILAPLWRPRASPWQAILLACGSLLTIAMGVVLDDCRDALRLLGAMELKLTEAPVRRN